MRTSALTDPTAWSALTSKEEGELVTKAPLDALWTTDNVTLKGGELRFGLRTWRSIGSRTAPNGLLQRFLNLQADSQFLGFAKRFGPLGVGEAISWEMLAKGVTEPVQLWRTYQRQFSELLRLAATMREREPISKESIEFFADAGEIASGRTIADILRPRGILDAWNDTSEADRQRAAASLITVRIARYGRWCELRPVLLFTRRESEADLVFQDHAAAAHGGKGISLFGALVVQLMVALTVSGFALCSGCGRAFAPGSRQPRIGKRRRFCQECRRAGMPKRLAKADFRRKRLEGRRKRPNRTTT
jgi:hypothetical protein